MRDDHDRRQQRGADREREPASHGPSDRPRARRSSARSVAARVAQALDERRARRPSSSRHRRGRPVAPLSATGASAAVRRGGAARGTSSIASRAIRARHLRLARAGGRGRRSAPRRRGSRGASRGWSARPGTRSRAARTRRQVDRLAAPRARKHLKPPVRSRTGRPRTIARVPRAAAADDPAQRAPSRATRAAGDVARAEREVGARRARPSSRRARSAGSCEKSASISSTKPAPRVQRVREAREVGRAEALRAPCGAAPRPSSCSAARRSAMRAGPVRRAVVDDEDAVPVRRGRARAPRARRRRSPRCSRPRRRWAG